MNVVGWLSRDTSGLGAGWLGFEQRQGQYFTLCASVQTGSLALSVSYAMDIGRKADVA
jgi:hypothetical protein